MGFNIEKGKEPNTWHLDVRVRVRGKEGRRRETFYGTKIAAQERFVELKWLLREHLLGSTDAPPNSESPPLPSRKLETFKDVLDLYREYRQGRGAVDETRFRALTRDLGDVPIPAFADRFEAYLKTLQNTPSKATGKPLANGTLNRFVALASAAFTQAVDAELLEKNPLSKRRFSKLKEHPRDRVLSDFELQKLMAVIAKEGPHILPIFRYAMQVPCRKSELVNMKREHLNLEGSPPSIWIPHGTTKNGRGCYKPIPPDMLDYFRSIPQECSWLFYRKNSLGYHSLGCFNKIWYKCLKLAGISEFRWHDSRRSAATDLLNRGTPSQVVQTIANWKTDMLKVYYKQDGQKALSLAKFDSKGSGHLVDALPSEAA